VLYGEAELAQSSETVGLSALRFIRDISRPVTVRMFGFDKGWAASHWQIGALAPMQALVFDWLDKAMCESSLCHQKMWARPLTCSYSTRAAGHHEEKLKSSSPYRSQ